MREARTATKPTRAYRISRLLRSTSLATFLKDLNVKANPSANAKPRATTPGTPRKLKENTMATEAARYAAGAQEAAPSGVPRWSWALTLYQNRDNAASPPEAASGTHVPATNWPAEIPEACHSRMFCGFPSGVIELAMLVK